MYADRMSAAAWSKYVANGRNPAVYKPSRRALEYKVPDEGYPLDGAWAEFFDFLMRRYHWGSGRRGATWAGSSSSTSRTCSCGRSGRRRSTGDPFARPGRCGSGRRWRRCWRRRRRSRRGCGTRRACSRRRPRTPRSWGGWSRTTWSSRPPCWTPAPRSATRRTPRSRGRTTTTPTSRARVATRVQLLRDRLRGRWVGRTDVAGAPNVWITEGGARPSKLKTLYPGEDPLAAQARCLQTSWDLHSAAAGGGAGVAMIGAVPALRRPELGLRPARGGAVDGQTAGVRDVEVVPESACEAVCRGDRGGAAREGAARPARRSIPRRCGSGACGC